MQHDQSMASLELAEQHQIKASLGSKREIMRYLLDKLALNYYWLP